jgi:hypothetical protein
LARSSEEPPICRRAVEHHRRFRKQADDALDQTGCDQAAIGGDQRALGAEFGQ